MAKHSSTATRVANKSHSPSFQTQTPPLVDGLVHHALVPASTQVRILSIIDETGSATIGDIVAGLPDHPDPVGAVMVMERLEILVLEVKRILDADTIVRRAPDPDPVDPVLPGSVPPVITHAVSVSGEAAGSIPAGLERLEVTPFQVSLVVGSGEARRSLARLPDLQRPGIYGLMNDCSIYIGMGGDVAARIANGRQAIDPVDTVFAITDATGNLTVEDAKAAERILWTRVASNRERTLVNTVPDGAPIDPQRYSELDAFVAQACLALRHHEILFTHGSARSVLAGPRTEPGRVGPLRPLNDIPDGEVLELGFGGGLMALAARQAEDRWVLLRGSDVRAETVSSANATARYLRSAWLHSGVLDGAPDGRSYVVKSDLVFSSGSAVAHFCCGSKAKGLSGWQPIDPDGGYDPKTPALIAS